MNAPASTSIHATAVPDASQRITAGIAETERLIASLRARRFYADGAASWMNFNADIDRARLILFALDPAHADALDPDSEYATDMLFGGSPRSGKDAAAVVEQS